MAAKMRATGVALHYFDASLNSDKYYRIYLFKTVTSHQTIYHVVSHWGRDGAVNGQSKEMTFDTWSDARNYAVKLGDSKMRKGYEWLGEKEIDYTHDLHQNGVRLMKATGRVPTKVAGFALVIQEEADLLELLMA